MAKTVGIIKIGGHNIKSTRQTIKKLKAILDKLEVPHILDDVSFHNTLIDLYRMKTLHNTDVWKVEQDGSLSLKNRFGHNGGFDYRCLVIKSLLEFQFVDLDVLSDVEIEFLASQVYEFEFRTNMSANT